MVEPRNYTLLKKALTSNIHLINEKYEKDINYWDLKKWVIVNLFSYTPKQIVVYTPFTIKDFEQVSNSTGILSNLACGRICFCLHIIIPREEIKEVIDTGQCLLVVIKNSPLSPKF